MKLSPDYFIPSLAALREKVKQPFHAPPSQTLEMTETQYLRYKRLVWEADMVRRFEGMVIVVPAPTLNEAANNPSTHV